MTHRRGIVEQGITPFHRRSFARIRAIVLGEQLELDLDPASDANAYAEDELLREAVGEGLLVPA
jgi:hypothetical protein